MQHVLHLIASERFLLPKTLLVNMYWYQLSFDLWKHILSLSFWSTYSNSCLLLKKKLMTRHCPPFNVVLCSGRKTKRAGDHARWVVENWNVMLCQLHRNLIEFIEHLTATESWEKKDTGRVFSTLALRFRAKPVFPSSHDCVLINIFQRKSASGKFHW